jgi:ABC-type antimicrobial peptide transport system permease subunit
VLKNYFKLALRNFKKYKGITLIQLLGFSAGLAICLLIMLVIRYEYSFDKFNKKEAHIYRVTENITKDNSKKFSVTTPYPLPAVLRADNPELKKVVAMHIQKNGQVMNGDHKLFKEFSIVFSSPEILDVFDIDVKSGNGKSALSQPNQVILSQSAAKKYFGDRNPIGQLIKLDNKLDLQVAGIMNDWPATSHLVPSMLVSYQSFTKEYIGMDISQWGLNMSGRTYFLAPDNFNESAFRNNLGAFVKKYFSPQDAEGLRLDIQPMKDFHLSKSYTSEADTPAISTTYLNIFSLIAGLILLVAIINYVNLTTARGILRNREIGVRKLIGASRVQVALQLLAETMVLTLFSGFLAIVIVEAVIPFFNQLFEKSVSLNLSPSFISAYLLFLALLSLVAGAYPALILSSTKPLLLAQAKQLSTGVNSKQWVRQTLVTVQFACAVIFVFGSLVIALQIKYVHQKDPGFVTQNILNVSLPEAKDFDVLRRELTGITGVENVTFNLGAPVSDNNFGTSLYTDKNNKNRIDIQVKPTDAGYLKTFGLKMVAGRWFNEDDERYANFDLPENQQHFNFIINEKLAHTLGFTDVKAILGRRYKIGVNDIEGEIVGVLKDFNYKSMHDPIESVLLTSFPFFYYNAGIQLAPGYPASALRSIEKIYSSHFPDTIFEYSFLDETMNKFYKADERAFNILLLFAGLALLLACMGLVGLSVFVIQRRFKEIGIRKVLGSTVTGIVKLLSWEFLKPVLFACLIAFPISWWAMNRWLNDFAYRINMTWWMLAAAGIFSIIIALVTVGFQSIKAAIANPTINLRTE